MASPSPIYQSLDPALKHIRVLELLPGVFESDLRGIIRTVALKDKPSYEALSYTWGTQTEGRTLKIRPDAKWKSVGLPITDNLFRALRRLRRLYKTRVLWVDAVCINQEDIDERSAQVALMEEIYSNAASTAIWLGEMSGTNIHDEDLTTGRRLVQFASSIFRDTWLDLLWNSDCLPMDHAIRTTTPSWKDRGWIIQEYVLSQRPYFQFGSKTRTIGRADPGLGHRGFAVPDSGFILEKKIVAFPGLWGLAERLKQLDQIRLELERGKLVSLYHAALVTGTSKTTDPRDKVYSLLSFLNPTERKLVYPDYRSSVELVFSRATYASLKSPTNFAILELIKFDTLESPSALPTWAYDFRTQDPYSRLIQFQHPSEIVGAELPSLQINADSTELKLEGACADIVVGAIPLLHGFKKECSDHSSHDINTEACVIAEISRKAVELVKLAERLIRGNVATEIPNRGDSSDETNAGGEHREFISNQIFATGTIYPQETVVFNLFENWKSITTYLGIPRANHISQSSAHASRPMLNQTRYYCDEASGSTAFFITTSGSIGLAPSTIKGGDRLVLPLCETAIGEIDAKVTPFDKPLALILRHGEDDKWTFHGLAHLEGLGDKAQYIQNSELYVIR